ncbi:SDR family NAD(P)-dependent oxidoreductase [Aspergillus foveolatus]|uniref:SDR family NAD(P)-dependent oxidoreductase n=1 Tax=Aspergillus foveolatus TaxID=210207 RepID=UPI003CCCF98C
MLSSIAGRVYMIKGAASCIGRETAITVARLGAAGLAISDVNTKGLQETKEECNAPTNDQITSWTRDSVQHFGRLDGAANVAGIATGEGSTTCQTMTAEGWDRMMDVNLKGVMLCMRAQLPHLLHPGGAVVNVSSTAGLRGLPHNAAYSASKFGVIILSETVSGEFGPLGVRINSLLPQAQEVAKVLCFLLFDNASYVTGAHWTVNGGYSAC